MSIEIENIHGAISFTVEDDPYSHDLSFAVFPRNTTPVTDAEAIDLIERIKDSDFVTNRLSNTPQMPGSFVATRREEIETS